MCGICGIFSPGGEDRNWLNKSIRTMNSYLFHRGPDGAGIFMDGRAGLGHTRLSIIDLDAGWQPMSNEDGMLWIVFNGKIFNYLELREHLIEKGHSFKTRSDTEVIIHLIEEVGYERALSLMNGQFAIGLYNRREREILLARDRFGLRPLFFRFDSKGRLIFASEIKAILSLFEGESPSLNIEVIKDVFTLWTPLSGKTMFQGVEEVPPGSFLVIREKGVEKGIYWEPLFLPDEEKEERPLSHWVDEITSLLLDSARLRLRADVPVGAYLSGGLDSSGISALVKRNLPTPLSTFSIAFKDKDFDESPFQREMAGFLGTEHRQTCISFSDIVRYFSEVVWHTEVPIIRTAPVPMFLLSRLVRDSGSRVVITGEGADEIFAGYDIFKEAKILEFWSRDPDSRMRPLLLKRLYPYSTRDMSRSFEFLKAFYKKGIEEPLHPFFSHLSRWRNSERILDYLSDWVREEMKDYSPLKVLEERLPSTYKGWSILNKAQYLEIITLMQNYLLSSQGDRMAMANGIESRYPYLDHRIFELMTRVPDRFKLPFLEEKFILKKVLERILPQEILSRVKRPYMAPDVRAFFRMEESGDGEPYSNLVYETLSEENIRRAGLFDPERVRGLIRKCERMMDAGFRDNMAFIGILSTQLLHDNFIERFRRQSTPPEDYYRIVIEI